MNFYDKNIVFTAQELNTSLVVGLGDKALQSSIKKYGKNKLTEKKKAYRIFGYEPRGDWQLNLSAGSADTLFAWYWQCRTSCASVYS